MPRRRDKGLRERHKKILEVLERHSIQHGYPPTIREICSRTGITSTSVVNYYMDQLEDMEYIERDRKISRGVRLLKPLSETATTLTSTVKHAAKEMVGVVSDMLRIPIAGRIVASEPVPVPASDFNYYDAESAVDIARSLLPSRETGTDLFALEVKGDSMIDAMVNDGDIVIMKPAQEAHNGEMVAIWLGDKDETTLKYFYIENGRIRLQPANPTMKPIFIDDPSTLQIQGKVVMVIRQVKSPVI